MRNACAAFAATLLIASVSAQQTVPFANGIPVAPEIPIPPMPAKPVEYATAEGMKIKVSVVTRGIEHPWSIAFVSNDVWLVTQTHGGLRVVRNGALDPEPVKGVPEVKPARRSGLLEVTLHPKFAENKYVYLTYHKPLPNDKGALALARGRRTGCPSARCRHPPSAGSYRPACSGPARRRRPSTCTACRRGRTRVARSCRNPPA